MIEIGAKLPNTTFGVMGNDGPGSTSTADIFAGKKIAVFAVPGAFTPTCHKSHMPSFVSAADALLAKGVDAIVCISVNDVFVMRAWAEVCETAGKITMLSDEYAVFSKAMGMDIDLSARGLGIRSRRYSALVDDGVLTVLNVEEKPGEAVCSIGEVLLDQI